MRITQQDKAKNRAKIVETAARLFRERGLPNVAIADLMREAGFTHGGFYNHFASKEALAAEVCSSTIARDEGFASDLLGPSGDDTWRSFVETYLSPEHRDDPSTGCTLAALLGDAARTPEVQDEFAGASGALVDLIGRYFARRSKQGEEAGRRRAIGAITQMMGAVSLSRATVGADRAFADEILTVCRERLLPDRR